MGNNEIWAKDIADFLGLPLYGENVRIMKVSSLSNIKENSLVFAKKASIEGLQELLCRGDVFAILPMDCEPQNFQCPRVFSNNPRLSFARTVEKFFAEKSDCGISPLALVHENSSTGEKVSIGPYSIIEEGVYIGDGTEIRNNVLIKKGTRIGKNCIIRAFTVIGEEGFGFEKDEDQRPIRLTHIGGVRIDDDVEIGNFCTICRGTIEDTEISDGVKIDDHCHIAHNVRIGENTIVTAGAVLSGSSSLGINVWIGPNATVLNGLSVQDNSTVGIGSVVIRNIKENSHVLGNPATRSR